LTSDPWIIHLASAAMQQRAVSRGRIERTVQLIEKSLGALESSRELLVRTRPIRFIDPSAADGG
jgi:hypothetical protein